MDNIHLRQLIVQGEGLHVEFKRCRDKLNRSVFESVCAFLNRHGGHLFLGVADDGEIIGVEPDGAAQIVSDFTTAMNNPQKLFPTFYLSPQVVGMDGKTIVYITVPESSQVHQSVGRIFDRNDEGDFDISANTSQVAQLYQRKQSIYTENTVYPFVALSDLRGDLLERARIRAKNENGGSHPWLEMDNAGLLRSAQLYKKDLQTGKAGYTLAAVLLFGNDETILNALPHHRTDAIVRRVNLDRYDDRDDIRTNLLDSYDRLMAFVAKHLPDPFYLEGDVRISLRNKVFREAVANSLIHREYINAFPARVIIEQNQVVFKNANRPYGHGLIDPDNFTPYPKNPVIARVFKEMGFADELGSGVRNLFKYTALYANGETPRLFEDDVFSIHIPIAGETTMQATMQAEPDTMQDKRIENILAFCRVPRTREEIQDYAGIKNRDHLRRKIIKPLLEQGLLISTIPEKPTSPKQKYYAKGAEEP
ncbi:MAG: AAA family ATPase [Gammaproteobacteria bacterium]|nr:AAA family ATPase [Gammaproteobacteria bacterium]